MLAFLSRLDTPFSPVPDEDSSLSGGFSSPQKNVLEFKSPSEQINPSAVGANLSPGYLHPTDCCTADLPFLDCHKFSYNGLYLPHLQIYVGFY